MEHVERLLEEEENAAKHAIEREMEALRAEYTSAKLALENQFKAKVDAIEALKKKHAASSPVEKEEEQEEKEEKNEKREKREEKKRGHVHAAVAQAITILEEDRNVIHSSLLPSSYGSDSFVGPVPHSDMLFLVVNQRGTTVELLYAPSGKTTKGFLGDKKSNAGKYLAAARTRMPTSFRILAAAFSPDASSLFISFTESFGKKYVLTVAALAMKNEKSFASIGRGDVQHVVPVIDSQTVATIWYRTPISAYRDPFTGLGSLCVSADALFVIVDALGTEPSMEMHRVPFRGSPNRISNKSSVTVIHTGRRSDFTLLTDIAMVSSGPFCWEERVKRDESVVNVAFAGAMIGLDEETNNRYTLKYSRHTTPRITFTATPYSNLDENPSAPELIGLAQSSDGDNQLFWLEETDHGEWSLFSNARGFVQSLGDFTYAINRIALGGEPLQAMRLFVENGIITVVMHLMPQWKMSYTNTSVFVVRFVLVNEE